MNRESTHIFRSFDGTQLEGTLCSPGTDGGHLALLVHGITSSRDELGLFSGLALHLADLNVASFRFDYRCHGVRSAPLPSMTLAGIVNDIEAACRCAHEVWEASTIHAIGMSFGGGLTAYWTATTAVRIHSVVLLAPVIDYIEDVLAQHGLIENAHLNDASASALARDGHLETDGIKYGSALLNELPYINGIVGLRTLSCRSLILHGDADSIVPYSLSERFAALNPSCTLVNVPGTDHGFGIPGDDDLTTPATKARHAEVFSVISDFLLTRD